MPAKRRVEDIGSSSIKVAQWDWREVEGLQSRYGGSCDGWPRIGIGRVNGGCSSPEGKYDISSCEETHARSPTRPRAHEAAERSAEGGENSRCVERV